MLQITHECRVDPSSPRYDVLTTRYKGHRYPNTSVWDHKSPNNYVKTAYDTFFGSEIVRWNRVDNVIEPLYVMFDFANPQDDMFWMSWDKARTAARARASYSSVTTGRRRTGFFDGAPRSRSIDLPSRSHAGASHQG